jgi:hypothetical protein
MKERHVGGQDKTDVVIMSGGSGFGPVAGFCCNCDVQGGSRNARNVLADYVHCVSQACW